MAILKGLISKINTSAGNLSFKRRGSQVIVSLLLFGKIKLKKFYLLFRSLIRNIEVNSKLLSFGKRK